MKNYNLKNNVIKRIILISLFVVSTNAFHAQTYEVDYSNPDITMEDMNVVLETLKMNVYKFSLHLPDSLKYKVCLFLEEYEDKEMIKEKVIWCTTSPYVTLRNGERISKPFDGARFVVKENKDDFLLNIRMGDFGIPDYKVPIDSIYSNTHMSSKFTIENNTTLQEGKTPLILIGSSWESTSKDGSTSMLRFCLEKELAPDYSNEAFDMMPHYFIVGLNVTKQEVEED